MVKKQTGYPTYVKLTQTLAFSEGVIRILPSNACELGCAGILSLSPVYHVDRSPCSAQVVGMADQAPQAYACP